MNVKDIRTCKSGRHIKYYLGKCTLCLDEYEKSDKRIESKRRYDRIRNKTSERQLEKSFGKIRQRIRIKEGLIALLESELEHAAKV
jgi:hypothetical protein